MTLASCISTTSLSPCLSASTCLYVCICLSVILLHLKAPFHGRRESRGPRDRHFVSKNFLYSVESFPNLTFSRKSFSILIRQIVSRLPQIFQFLTPFYYFLLLFHFFTIPGPSRAPVTEPGPGAAYPLSPSNRPCTFPTN